MARNQTSSVIVDNDGQPDDPMPIETERDESTGITKDDLFHVLQNERRRRVLKYLLSNGSGPFEMRTIAEHVAAEEHDTTVQALTSDERQRVYIALYQSHLPKLDEKGFIDYQQSRGIVEKRPLVEETTEHLRTDTDESSVDQPNTDRAEDGSADQDQITENLQATFGAATAASVLLVTVAYTNVIPILSGLTVAMVVVALFGLLSMKLIHSSE